MLLECIKHPTIIEMIDVIPALNNRDLYIVFEYADSDLHKVNQRRILTELHLQFISY